ncbi:MAG TPA: CsbD family protein [Solirubrobacterales bacterium]|nr:CsbD family protein [Solirubrobacterales bacterium]
MAGKMDKAKGRTKKAIGELADDENLKSRGGADKAKGKAKSGIDTATKKVKSGIKRAG